MYKILSFLPMSFVQMRFALCMFGAEGFCSSFVMFLVAEFECFLAVVAATLARALSVPQSFGTDCASA